uniref:Protein tyrosine phosphatase 4A1 n=1 Tax=Oncorhynchus kisutch TaxID=8019 RepID=A0A8C7DSP9_ONCKI
MNRPAPVEITYKNMRFLITHNPTNATLNKFIEELKKYGVTTVVRVCEATYDSTLVGKEGIQVLVSFNITYLPMCFFVCCTY